MSTLLLVFYQQNSALQNDFNAAAEGFDDVLSLYDENGALSKSGFEKLLKYVSGIEDITAGDLSPLESKLQSGNITAADMRSFTTGGKTNGNDISFHYDVSEYDSVTLTPVYLTISNSGDIILTCWSITPITGGSLSDPIYVRTSVFELLYGQIAPKLLNLNLVNARELPYFSNEGIVLNYINASCIDRNGCAFINTDLTYSPETLYNTFDRASSSGAAQFTDDIKSIFPGFYYEAQELLSNLDQNTGGYLSALNLFLPSIMELNEIWKTSENQNGTNCWLRDAVPSLDGVAQYCYVYNGVCDSQLVGNGNDSMAIRPAMNINLTKMANSFPKPLDQTVAEFDPDDPTNEAFKDIYKITTETGVDFHIKTAEGFKKFSEAIEFDPSWTFYLDNDITLNLDGTYIPIGSYENPFTGTFNGQGCTLNFNLTSDSKNGSIFGTISDSTFCNLNTNYDVNITGDNMCFYGLCFDQEENTTCNLSHINVFGKIVAPHEIFVLGTFGFFSGSQCFQNLYDVNVYLTSAEAPDFIFAILDDFDMNSCNFICPNIIASQILMINFEGEGKISNSQFDAYSASSFIGGIATPRNRERTGNLTIVESSFNIKLDSAMASALGLEGALQKVTLLDVSINCSSFVNIIANYDTFSGVTNYPEGCYYSGVYIHDPKSNTTTILDPNFTSYKWCADPHLNNGLPQLRRFVSIGEHMEQCDMAAWAASQ